MQQISTSELLVKHLYNETTIEEATIVNKLLKDDSTIQEEFKQIQAAKYALDETDGYEPNKSVIDKILTYSKKSATELV
jgi:hypothetical protein